MSKVGSRKEKRKSEEPEPDPILVLGCSSEDRITFLMTDFLCTQSVKNIIPLVPSRGKKDAIPMIWRGLDDNPRNAIFRIKVWRLLNEDEQKEQAKLCSLVNPNSFRYREYSANIRMLHKSRKEIIAGIANWSDVGGDKDPTVSLPPYDTLRPPPRQASKQDAHDVVAKCIVYYCAREVHKCNRLSKKPRKVNPTNQPSAAENVAPQPPTATTQVTPPPPLSPPQQTRQPLSRLEPNSPPGESTSIERDKVYTGRASSQAERNAEADRLDQAASSGGKKRLFGKPCSKAFSQGDSQAWAATETATRKVATAADTIHCPTLVQGQPRRRLLLIEVNEVVDTGPSGGGSSNTDIKREKPLVTITGAEDPADVRDMMLTAARCFKHDDPQDAELVAFYRDKETNLVFPGVQQHFKNREKKRARPPQKPATLEEIRDMVHARAKKRMPVRRLPSDE